jgi:hypothetical protein
VQFPFAAGRNQPIRYQNLQDLVPPSALAVHRQAISPELIEPQLTPQLAGQPARAPLPRPAQAHLRQAKLHDRIVGHRRSGAILGKQRQCPPMSDVLVENLDGLAPGRRLGRADLA